MDENTKGVFETLHKLNVNDKTDKKSNLTYLSWTFAWEEVKKLYPSASYKIWRDEKGNPFTFSETLGYMCYTTVCIEGETLEMWLPVMNGANKAMLSSSYSYTTKHGDKDVEAATMFDINKTIMRCLVKNLAMFGLGLYIYAGEDLPEQEPVKQTVTDGQVESMCKNQDEAYLRDCLVKLDLTEFQVKAINTKLGIK